MFNVEMCSSAGNKTTVISLIIAFQKRSIEGVRGVPLPKF